MHRDTKDNIVALSLANLCFLPVWEKLGYYKLGDCYFLKVSVNSYIAFIFGVLILTIIFRTGIFLWRQANNTFISRVGKAFLGLLVLYFYFFTLSFLIEINWLRSIFRYAIIILVIIFFVKRIFTKMAIKAILVMTPLVFIIISQATWAMIKNINDTNKVVYTNNFLKVGTGAPKKPVTPRVVWLIFDGMDQQSMFDNKQVNAKLHEFHRLQQQALTAENAYPPGGHTRKAIPSLFTGRKVVKAKTKSKNDLMITYQGSDKPVSWRSQPSIFSQTKALQLKTALVGWYHPYSRIYANQVTFCTWNTWHERYYDVLSSNDTLLANITTQFLGLMPLQHRFHKIKVYLDQLNSSVKLVANTEFDLIVIHLSIPHAPYIYNESTGRLRLTSTGLIEGLINENKKLSYAQDLVLADKTLTMFRKAMEETGLWDSTTLLISADHKNWGQNTIKVPTNYNSGLSDRIPFILKFAGQKQPISYKRTFNTVLTKDLILAIMERKITSETEIVGWLDQHRQ